MKEIDDALNALINVIKSTKEYNQYQTLLKKVKNAVSYTHLIQNFRVRLCFFREFPKKIRWNLSYRKLWN